LIVSLSAVYAWRVRHGREKSAENMNFFRRLLAGAFDGKDRQQYRMQSVYVGDHTLLIRTQSGHKIYADSRDLSVVPTLVFKGHWEPWVAQVMQESLRPGMHVADIGAHVGCHTCIMASAVGPTGHVHAIEANPRLAGLLRMTIAANGIYDYATCHQVVVGERPGEIDFHLFRGLMGSSSVLPMQAAAANYGDTVDVQRLKCEPLDQIIPDGRLDAMKIDCEGSEPAIIAGAQRLLGSSTLRHIFMEYSPYFYVAREAPVRMFADLERFGFRFSVVGRRGKPTVMSREQVLALDGLFDMHLFRE
jgi:FkbM family methyltransferase